VCEPIGDERFDVLAARAARERRQDATSGATSPTPMVDSARVSGLIDLGRKNSQSMRCF
jgi:aminoglycoside phosphotransferase